MKTLSKFIFAFLIAVFFFNPLYAQYRNADSCVHFTLHINAAQHPSDTIRLLYYDCEKIYSNQDTIILTKGKATIAGKVNRATEGIIFTDLNNRLMDGPGVIRFIIEPTTMSLSFTAIKGGAKDVVIKGSLSQKQKERWEKGSSATTEVREELYRQLAAIDKNKGVKDSSLFMRRKGIADSIDLLRHELATNAMLFAKGQPGSFVSAYLLNHYKRTLPVDSLTKYYSLLSPNVRQSDFGKTLLNEIFRLTEDLSFREKYSDSTHFINLKNIGGIHDIGLTNLEGSKTHFSKYKGKYLFLDFWGSWCGPCFANAPYLRKLITELKDLPIEFVSVSMDEDVDVWKASVKKHNFPGINLFDDSGILSTYYKVLFVPRYIIIRPDGTIANSDAPPPVDPKLKKLLLELVAEKKQ